MRTSRRKLLMEAVAGAALAVWPGRVAFAQTSQQYAYDELGRLTSVTYSNGMTITYGYDAAGNRTQLAQTAATPAPSASITASPDGVLPGQSTTLTWTTTNATSASIDNGVGVVTPVASGSISVVPTVSPSTKYTLTATGPGGVTSSQVSVNIAQYFSQTIQITGSGPVNLRTLANNAGYNGAQNATITFVVGSAVSLKGAAGTSAVGGGRCIETGTWPSANYAIALTLQISGKVYGGGGGGGYGAFSSNGSIGTVGGDALYAQENLTVVVNAGGELKAGGGGGGGGGAWTVTWTDGEGMPESTDYSGGQGGGGFPNGQGGSLGTTSGGGAGSAGETAVPTTRVNGAGGAGGGAAAAGSSGVAASGSGGTGGGKIWFAWAQGGGGQPGYAVRKNGKTVSVTNNGTIMGTQA